MCFAMLFTFVVFCGYCCLFVFRAKLEKMPSIPEEPEVPENEVERFTMPDFIKPLYDLDVIEGKEAVLKCKVAGLPYPTIAWFHNGKRIESTEDRRMTQCKYFRMVSHLISIQASLIIKAIIIMAPILDFSNFAK